MISNNQIKLFSSLRNKKYREIHHKFLAEGEKIVLEILHSSSRIFDIQCLIATNEFIKVHGSEVLKNVQEIYEVSAAVLDKISSLNTPNQAILVCGIPDHSPDFPEISEGISLFLDDIRDPGNLGTIMRTADWFGIRHIFCTRESVDVFNPKVVQSTMGSLCRVKVYYIETSALLKEVRKIESFPLIGTVLDGDNIYTSLLPSRGIIVLGNESQGISQKLKEALNFRLLIQSYGNNSETSESLNVASAAAIVIAEFRRRQQVYSK